MDNLWNRFLSKIRGDDHGAHAVLSADGTAALVADVVAPHEPIAAPREIGAAERPRWLTWLINKFTRHTTATQAALAQLTEAVERIADLSQGFEHHLAAQQSRTEELLLAMRQLSTSLAGVPNATAEQARQVERLKEAVAAHHAETQRITSILNEMPVALKANGAAIARHGEAIASQRGAIDALAESTRAADQVRHATLEHVQQVGHVQQQIAQQVVAVSAGVEKVAGTARKHSGALATLLKDRGRHAEELTQTIRRQARKTTIMMGAAIAVASASAALGALNVLLRFGLGGL